MRRENLKKQLGSLGIILLGNAVYALAVAAFILPNDLVTGGGTGLALIARRLWGVEVEVFAAVFNAAMFLLGLLILGKRFAATTLVSSFWYPLVLGVFQRVPGLPFPTGDPLLAVLAAGCLVGVGMGLVIRSGASTGGMDIPPLVLHRTMGLPVSAGIYGFDCAILLGQLLFVPRESALYGILLVAVYTLVLDKVLVAGSARTQVKVVSPRYEEIREGILRELDRGCTLLSAETGFLGNRWPMVVTVVSGRELHRLTRLVQELDPGAFLVVSRVSEVRGRGFSLGKVHRSREKGEGAD